MAFSSCIGSSHGILVGCGVDDALSSAEQQQTASDARWLQKV